MSYQSHQVLQQDKDGKAVATKKDGTTVALAAGGPYEIDGASDVWVGDLWVLAGQSNMEGVGDLIDVETPSPHVRSLQSREEWAIAEEPLHWLFESPRNIHHRIWGPPNSVAPATPPEHDPSRTKGAGLGLTFAKAWHDATGAAVGLIPSAHGGTSMEQWDPALRDRGGDSLYGATYERIKKCGGRVRGVLWYQGESDADPVHAGTYTRKMEELVAAFRSDTGQPDLPFYLVQLGRFATPGNPQADYSWSAIRERQRLLPDRIPNTEVVAAIDLELDDAIHIGTSGQKRLGRRLARIATGHAAPSLRDVTLQTSPLALRVRFDHVEGALTSPGRPSGFSLRRADGSNDDKIYKTVLEGDTAVLLVADELTLGDCALYYGYGLNPYCNIVDAADQSLPALGPWPLRKERA
jgi:sialate O-acetylesterase